MSRYNLLRWNGTRVVDDRGVGLVEVGCGLGAFWGHEMPRCAASFEPCSGESDYQSAGQRLVGGIGNFPDAHHRSFPYGKNGASPDLQANGPQAPLSAAQSAQQQHRTEVTCDKDRRCSIIGNLLFLT